MTVVYTQKASGINTTIYDTSPYIAPSAGEGAPGYVKTQEDQVAVAQTGFGTAGNFYRVSSISFDCENQEIVKFFPI